MRNISTLVTALTLIILVVVVATSALAIPGYVNDNNSSSNNASAYLINLNAEASDPASRSLWSATGYEMYHLVPLAAAVALAVAAAAVSLAVCHYYLQISGMQVGFDRG